MEIPPDYSQIARERQAKFQRFSPIVFLVSIAVLLLSFVTHPPLPWILGTATLAGVILYRLTYLIRIDKIDNMFWYLIAFVALNAFGVNQSIQFPLFVLMTQGIPMLLAVLSVLSIASKYLKWG